MADPEGIRRFARPTPLFFKYSMKYNILVSVRPNYIIFHGIFNKSAKRPRPHTHTHTHTQRVTHMNPLSRNPGSAPNLDVNVKIFLPVIHQFKHIRFLVLERTVSIIVPQLMVWIRNKICSFFLFCLITHTRDLLALKIIVL